MQYPHAVGIVDGEALRDRERTIGRGIVGDDDAPLICRQVFSAPAAELLDTTGEHALFVVAGDDEVDAFHQRFLPDVTRHTAIVEVFAFNAT